MPIPSKVVGTHRGGPIQGWHTYHQAVPLACAGLPRQRRQHACPCARDPAQLGARRMATPSRPRKRGRAKEEIQSQRPCGAKAAAHKRGQLGRAAAPSRKRAAAALRRCRCASMPVRGRGSCRGASIGSVTVGCQAEHFWCGEREMHCPAVTGLLEVSQGLGGNTHLPPQGQS